MNIFSRIIVSVILTGIYFCIPHFSYAASGKTLTGTSLSGGESRISTNSGGEVNDKDKKTSSGNLKEEESDEIDNEEEEKIKEEINASYIDFGKDLGGKAIKELTITYNKRYPDPADRIKAFKGVRKVIYVKSVDLQKSKTSEMRKLILTAFLDHMLDLLNEKIEELEK